jgi:pimeloyl-ACP methyl ester carboxylesterase
MNFSFFYILWFLAFFTCGKISAFDINQNKIGAMMPSSTCRYDANCTRIRLVKSVPGTIHNDWLFLPGGPGVDSSSLLGLVNQVNLPGNYWLIDLIFNGTNVNHPITSDEVYHFWPRYVEELVNQFEHPILVGHSFGGYLPLFCPALEQSLKGLVIFNSVPTLKSDLFAKIAAEQKLPSLSEVQKAFVQNPTLETMKALYLMEADYFFTKNYRAQGIEQIVNTLEFCIATEHWWYREGADFYAEIKWVPQKIPTLIICGGDDFITPPAVYAQASNFQRENIQMLTIPAAGHFPWLEQPDLVNDALQSFLKRCP